MTDYSSGITLKPIGTVKCKIKQPVIDVKPYVPGYDSVAKAKVPPWVVKR